MSVTVTGMETLKRNLEKMRSLYGKGVTDAVLKGGIIVQSAAKRGISSGNRSGKVYERSGGKTHQASAPGEFPKTDHGVLVASIAIEPGMEISNVFCDVGTNLDYGRNLELKMNREFLFPSLEQNRSKIEGIIADSVAEKSQRGPE
jgi:hypothetical protein